MCGALRRGSSASPTGNARKLAPLGAFGGLLLFKDDDAFEVAGLGEEVEGLDLVDGVAAG